MKERPILFSPEMVRALLDGRKTQTRRMFTVRGVDGKKYAITSEREKIIRFDDGTFHYLSTAALSGPYPCPYGEPGDRLYVKERIQRGYCGNMSMSHYFADGFPTVADAWPWKRDHLPSIHCPRGLSRILLEITNVRVERLQEISEEDAKNEGTEPSIVGSDFQDIRYRAGFQTLWESINAKRGYGWEANPWVWIIEFKRLS